MTRGNLIDLEWLMIEPFLPPGAKVGGVQAEITACFQRYAAYRAHRLSGRRSA